MFQVLLTTAKRMMIAEGTKENELDTTTTTIATATTTTSIEILIIPTRLTPIAIILDFRSLTSTPTRETSK